MRLPSFLLTMALLCPAALRAESPAPAPVLQLDTAATGAPINPYLYGQFIEHLGRCIYGGIWAEMLEDRKFFFPVTATYAPYRDYKDTAFPTIGASPWEITGAPDSVTMHKENAFVGAHSPHIADGSGLRQKDLGVLAGKEYTGYLWARSTGGDSAELELSLSTGDGRDNTVATRLVVAPGDYARHAFSLRAPAGSDHTVFTISVHKAGIALGTVSLMPADNVRGMRRDTLALLRQLNSPIYRWPGGNFTSGYDWRDGIGDRDRRPPRGNPAWTGVEHNDFGTDEFLDFCREIGTEPMIAANTGFGDAYSAAQWVEYCNASDKTLAGSWRARNGHAQPYAVKHWCVGNEMFGPWQLGFMQLQHYTLKHNQVAAAMRAVDPGLVLSGVGAIDCLNKDNDPDQVKRNVNWSEGMLLACADNMDLISEHMYDGRVPWNKEPRAELSTHVTKLKTAIHHISDAHRALQARLPNLRGRVMPITLDEWNYWHREYTFGELGCAYDWADGLGVAEGLHELFRQSDLIHMAHYAQTVNVIGAIKTTRTQAEMETTGLVLQLYRAHFGRTPLKVTGDFGPLDISAALAADGRTLSIAIVNPTPGARTLPLGLGSRELTGTATRWTLVAPDEKAANKPGSPRQVDLREENGLDPRAPLQAPALSVVLYQLQLLPAGNAGTPAPLNPSGFRISRGTNLSHWLSQDFRWTPREKWLTEADIVFIAQQGFDHVRLPIDEKELWDEKGRPVEKEFKRLLQGIAWCRKAGLRVIVDLHTINSHHFNAANEGLANTLWTDPKAQEHYLSLWVELQKRLHDIPVGELAYEMLNEPVAEQHEDWNKLVAKSIALIRLTEPGRVLIVGANQWQMPQNLPHLKVPEGDKNLILSFHTYTPMLLTHHRADWVPIKTYEGPVAYPGPVVDRKTYEKLMQHPEKGFTDLVQGANDPWDAARLRREFEPALRRARELGLQLYCGEFGCLPTVPREARLAYYRDIISVFNAEQVAWCNWEYKGDFGLYEWRGAKDLCGAPDKELLRTLLTK